MDFDDLDGAKKELPSKTTKFQPKSSKIKRQPRGKTPQTPTISEAESQKSAPKPEAEEEAQKAPVLSKIEDAMEESESERMEVDRTEDEEEEDDPIVREIVYFDPPLGPDSQDEPCEVKGDRISNLPDCLVQHILSFFPTTKQAIRTSVLSKRWHKQWTAVPVLVIDSDDTNCQHILQFYNCLKIQKFYLDIHCSHSHFDEMLRFAMSRHVEDLALCCYGYGYDYKVVPDFFFDNVFLMKLSVRFWCDIAPKGKVNWTRFKQLDLCGCILSNQAMEHILLGCPLFEFFHLVSCHGFDELVIRSNSLKRLSVGAQHLNVLEISCPNLKELVLDRVTTKDSSLFDQVMKNVLWICSSLESLKLVQCTALDQLVIASESLKSLIIKGSQLICWLQVSCKKLEKLKFSGYLEFGKAELMNFPSSVFVQMDFTFSSEKIYMRDLTINILQQLHHVNNLKLGRLLIQVLSGLEARDLFCPALQAKCFVLKYPGCDREYLSRVARVLRNLPMLETLVITEELYKLYETAGDRPRLNDFDETYWSSICSYMERRLKTVKIIGLLTINVKVMLLFVEFLLKKARALEKMTIEIRDCGPEYLAVVSQKLLKIPRCSALCIVECYEVV